jgi:hypothetical protein
MKKVYRRQVFESGPHNGLTRKDVLFRKVAEAFLIGKRLTKDDLAHVFSKEETHEDCALSRWSERWVDWLLGKTPSGLNPYACGGIVVVPKRSREYADEVRTKLCAREHV